MKFTIEGIPQAQKRHRLARHGHMYDPSSRDKVILGKAISYLMMAQRIKPLEGDLRLKLQFYGCSGRPDLDNLIKLFSDAANGILWGDDRQVVEIQAQKFRHDDNPRTICEVEAA